MDTVAAGALGPRLAGRLTPELILGSPQYLNCVKRYEIDLRGNKLGAIENLGATEDQFESIDLSDNAIVFLEGFPKLNRLKVLLLNNNRVSRIGRGLEISIPNLEMLVLTNNKIEHLKTVDPLGALPKLEHLSLLGNPVTTVANYRQYVVHLCPKLKVLDFTKVKQKERDQSEAKNLFDPDKDVELVNDAPSRRKLTSEQFTAIKAAIQNAGAALIKRNTVQLHKGTLEEVRRLEAALKSGVMPSELQEEDAAEDPPTDEQQDVDMIDEK